jgi:predicted nucleic acid-binding protein
MGKNDLWIAASAAESGSLLITTDHDFDHLAPAHLSVWWLDPEATSWPAGPQ